MTIQLDLEPFGTPNYVRTKARLRPRQEGFTETPGIHISELSPETLAQLCDRFRADVFAKAGKTDPRVKAAV